MRFHLLKACSFPCRHSGIVPCDCEAVQLPTMSQNAAWTVLATRFKAVMASDDGMDECALIYAPCAPLSSGADAPLGLLSRDRERDAATLGRHPQESSSSPVRTDAPRAARTARRSSVAPILSIPSSGALPARSSCPVVLTTPSRVVARVVAHAHAAVADNARRGALSRLGGARDARDVLEGRRGATPLRAGGNPYSSTATRSLVRIPSVHRRRGV